MERDQQVSEESWIVNEAGDPSLNEEIDLLDESGWEEIIFMLEEIMRS